MTPRLVVLAAAAATAGSLALAPAAHAQPDAPYAITAVGSTDAIDGSVQVTITKPADARVTCQVIGVTAGTPTAEVASANRVFEGQYTVTGGDTWGWGFAPVPDGVYDVHWGCRDSDEVVWGSFASVPEERRLEPVRDIRVSHNPNATEGGSVDFDFGSLGSGSAS